MTAHDVFRPLHAARLAGKARLWVLGRTLRGLDALVAVGEDVRDNFLEYLPTLATSRCRMVCIPNGIDTSRFARPIDATGLRQSLGVGKDVFLLGFLGRFMEQKGFLPLLDALERLAISETARPFHLLAMGSGDYEREYRAEVQRRGLSQLISFVPFARDVAAVLRQLDLLVMPSLWEACPLLPMEAMAAGVPVLGSDCIGLREVLRGTPSRVAPAGDATAWSRALERAMAEPWPEAARRYASEARERFDVVPAARRLRALFDEELGLGEKEERRPSSAVGAVVQEVA
jgi:glycosyltransferase involved in cell wall biosynthesis